MPLSRSQLGLSLALVAGLLAGMQCAPISIRQPSQGELVDDPSSFLRATLVGEIDPATVTVELNGVDLIAALGLTPPFAGAGGVVVAGPDVLTVSGFDFDTGVAPFEVHLDVSGLPEGTSMLQVTGIRTSDGALIRPWIQFERVAPFALVAEALPGASSTFAPAVVGGTLANDSLGAPLAAAPVSDGTHELRSGFVEAAEGILRGTP